MTFNQSCYGLRVNEDKIINGYLYYILKQEVSQFKANATGATFGSITIRSFDSVIIPLPPLEIQQQIIDAMEEFEKNKNQFLIDGISIKEFEKLIKDKRNEVLKSYL